MKTKIVMFGLGKISDVVFWTLKERSSAEIVAYVCDSDFVPATPEKNGIPIVALDQIQLRFPSEKCHAFVAVGYQNLNDLRSKKCDQLKAMGYRLFSFVDPDYAPYQIKSYGENSFIMRGSQLQFGIEFGANNFVWEGALIGHHSTIGNNNWFTSGCKIAGCVSIGNGNFFAVNSTVSDNVKIGDSNFFGANTLVASEVKSDEVYISKATERLKMSAKKFSGIMNY